MDNLLSFNFENLLSLSFQKGPCKPVTIQIIALYRLLLAVSLAGNITYRVLRSFLTRARQEASGLAWASLSLKTARIATDNLPDCTTLWGGTFSSCSLPVLCLSP